MYDLGKNMPEVHVWCVDTIESLCDKIDKLGGWNPKALTVKFFHGAKSKDRKLCFSDNHMNTDYWTVCLTRDQYYWHKISDNKKKAFEREIRRKIRSSI